MIRILAVALSLGALPMAVAAQTPPPKSANATPIATTALGAIFYGAKSANPGERLFGQKCAFAISAPAPANSCWPAACPKIRQNCPAAAI
jgi:hypothetical protein